ncbi:MAG: anti-sigma factor [Chitinophagales bacterium]|nr:anti-sigma factor [Bacteroidota bacterium]MCB9256320.1 anti-sigma factor [Chitinophagales bacterium]
MNIKEYIESGVLELYLLGSLSAEEEREVAKLLKEHPELQKELERIEADLISLAESNAPESLNEAILVGALERIKAGAEESNATTTVIKELPVAGKSWLNYALIAASFALLLSLGLNVKLYTNVQEAESQILALQNQNSVFAEELQIQNTNYSIKEKQVFALSDPNVLRIKLNAVPGKEGALAMVYWNSESKETYISVQNLPEPPEGMQYQLWALYDGAPIDAGVFDLNGEIQENKTIENAQAFAITLEEAGGKPSPNLEQLYVYGEV